MGRSPTESRPRTVRLPNRQSFCLLPRRGGGAGAYDERNLVVVVAAEDETESTNSISSLEGKQPQQEPQHRQSPPCPEPDQIRCPTAATMTTYSNTSSPSITTKTVKFAHLEIREYNVIIGDHPCCTMGCPLSLGWEFRDVPMIAVDRYEATRSPRRNREELKTSREERRSRMLQEGQVSDLEMRRVERRLYRERSCSAKLCHRTNESFFCNNSSASF
jgi:hypothetical protein